MYIKVIIQPAAQDHVEGTYINSNSIIEAYYNVDEGKYLAICAPQMGYEISKADYEKITGHKVSQKIIAEKTKRLQALKATENKVGK